MSVKWVTTVKKQIFPPGFRSPAWVQNINAWLSVVGLIDNHVSSIPMLFRMEALEFQSLMFQRDSALSMAVYQTLKVYLKVKLAIRSELDEAVRWWHRMKVLKLPKHWLQWEICFCCFRWKFAMLSPILTETQMHFSTSYISKFKFMSKSTAQIFKQFVPLVTKPKHHDQAPFLYSILGNCVYKSQNLLWRWTAQRFRNIKDANAKRVKCTANWLCYWC